MNFSFSLKRLNTFPWWFAMDIIFFFFCANDILILLYDSSSIPGFLYFLSFLVQLFCFDYIINDYGIDLLFFNFLIPKPCLLSVFEHFCSCKKNNRYTWIPKHSLQTKKAMCSLILRLSSKRVILFMIKCCKSTSSRTFWQYCFSDQKS